VDVIAALTDYGISVTIYDLWPVQAVKGIQIITSNTVPNQSLMQFWLWHMPNF
jgi:hypothetical protein